MGLMRPLTLVLVIYLVVAQSSWAGCPDLNLDAIQEHETGYFRASTVKTQAGLLEANRRVIEVFEGSKSPAEKTSGNHQRDVVNMTTSERIAFELGLDRQALELGIIDSDKGKIASYKKLFTESSAKSDFLLDVLSLRGDTRSRTAMEEILVEIGFSGRTLLNRDMTNEQLRDVFRKAPVLQGFLHDMPGMADAFLAYEYGAITKKQLRDQILANLSHNGPKEGFWKLIADVFVPGALAKPEVPGGKDFFRNTIYEGAEGKIEYPGPQSAEGMVHTIGDRLSQGTRGGAVKIFHEISAFTKPAKALSEVLISNPKGTARQFDALLEHNQRMAETGRLTPGQAGTIRGLILDAKSRLLRYEAAVRSKIENLTEVEAAMAANQPPAEFVFAGRKITNETPPMEAVTYMESVLRKIESEVGDPMVSF